jgi:hypothetical protein
MKASMRIAVIFIVSSIIVYGCKTTNKKELTGYHFVNEWAETEPFSDERLTGSLTIDMFLILHGIPDGWCNIISKNTTENDNEFVLSLRDSRGRWYYGDGNRRYFLENWDPVNVFPVNEWFRLSIMRDLDDNSLHLYVNGELIETRQYSNLPNAKATHSSLVSLSRGRRLLEATLGEIRIWSKPLTSKELTETSLRIHKPHKQDSLVGYWIFENPQNGIIKDLSKNSRDLRIMQ